jgi:nucleoside-diphosphate-sugar epimerase
VSQYQGARVLVTGASGFLGSHAVRALVAQGARVHALVRPNASLERLNDVLVDLTICHGDVTDLPTIVDCFRKADPEIVFHLAGDVSTRRSQGGWDDVMRSIDVNLIGTINVIRAGAEQGNALKSLVRLGGLEEYGSAPVPYVESFREQPVSAYSAAQVAATHFSQAVQSKLEFQVVTVRPALVYGPGQSLTFFIPSLIESCLAGRTFDMTDGMQARDLIYVDDVIAGILLAGARGNLQGAIINLSTGQEHSMASIADKIRSLASSSIEIRKGARPTQPGDLQHLFGSPRLALELLGWAAQTTLDEGLSKTISYYAASRA